MFDDALPSAECELLARRLASDPALQRQWARYALIGAALRRDPLCGTRAAAAEAALEGGGLAARVQAALAGEPALEAHESTGDAAVLAGGTGSAGALAPRRWRKPVAATGIAATVAALSIVWLQRDAGEGPAIAAAPAGDAGVEVVAPQLAAVAPTADSTEVVLAPARSGEPESYVVPVPPATTGRPLASAQLANFVVAHSEFSGSLARRSVLSALVSGEDAADPAAAVDGPPDAAAGTQAAGSGR
jgi:negative regulator of sigma E activity